MVLFLCTSSDGGLYLYKVSLKWSGLNFQWKNFKGALFHKNVNGAMFVFLRTLSEGGLNLYTVS